MARRRAHAPRRAGEVISEQGEEPRGLQLLLEGEAQSLIVGEGRSEPVGTQHAPTWMGAIAALTGNPTSCACRHARPAGSRSSAPRTSAASRSRSPRSTGA